MKSKLFTTYGSLLIVIALFFASCTKEGPAGPAGPAGPQGPQGTAGAAGATGAQGPAGTANVFYSSWLDVNFTPSTDSSTWTGLITAPRLVDSIIQRGDVKVYVNVGTVATPTIVALPIDVFLFQFVLSPLYQVGRIAMLSDLDASTEGLGNQKTFQYRYIIIPGGTSTGRVATVDWKDYNAVKKYLDLKD